MNDTIELLRVHGIQPTAQRVLIARVLFARMRHLSADEIHRELAVTGKGVSKATVYNTLRLLIQGGVIREVIVDPGRVFYDPNTRPHHHFYNVDSGELIDIDAHSVEIRGNPSLPVGTQLAGIDVVFRLRTGK